MSKIAACLIVKNAADLIEKTVSQLRPHVDGVFVYDTGSSDDTIEIIDALNHQGDDLAPIVVKQGEWRDDFSWAREQSFAMVPDDYGWAIWLDDDDEIEGLQNLRALAAQANPDVDGFVAMYDYARDDHGNTVCVLWRERLVRLTAGLKWLNPVHEVLVHPDRPPQYAQLPPSILRYVHQRPPDRYGPTRNLDILQRRAEEQQQAGEPIDLRTLAYLGTELMAKQEWQQAAQYLQAYLERDEPGWSDERMQVAHKLAACAMATGNPLAAVEVEMRALRERDDWPETYVGLTEAFAQLKRWDRVERWAKRAIELGAPQTALIVNPLEFSVLPALRISEACSETGRMEEAEAWLTKAAAAAPGLSLVADRITQLEAAKTQHAALQSLLTLREVLVRHDENEKAYELLEHAVPYLVADHPAVVKARADQREMVKHLTEPDEYRRWYEDEPKDSTITDDRIDELAGWMGRVQGLLRGLEQQEQQLGRKPVVLDLGCNDWWMGEYLARHGYQCDGVELNKSSYNGALARRDRFGRDATIVQGDLHHARALLDGWEEDPGGHFRPSGLFEPYDAVVMYEVLEHVPDMQATLDVLESLLAPDGRVYLSTPSGAFEKGHIDGWARVERKGHLRALPLHEFAELLMERGVIEDLEETNSDRVAFASYTPRPRKGTVNFYAGQQWEPWSPFSLREGGIGGSETALVQIATRMAIAGWKVKVYSSSEQGAFGGALYRPFTAWDPTEQVDLLVVSRLAHVFDNPVGARQTALWCHDHSYDTLTPERTEKIDHVVVLSDWQRARFERLYPHAAEKLVVIRNGITVTDLDGSKRYPHAKRGFAKRLPRAIYSSSADRGLDVLLDLWPRIREQAPDAELHVFYGFETLDRVAAMAPGLAAFKHAILEKVDELGGETAGIHLRGRVGQLALADEMMRARVLAYPTAFLETSCITAMEARAAGLPIVTSDLGALHETAAGQTLLPWVHEGMSNGDPIDQIENSPGNLHPEYQATFVREVVAMLTAPTAWKTVHAAAVSGAETLDWSNRVPEWEALAVAPSDRVVTPSGALSKAA